MKSELSEMFVSELTKRTIAKKLGWLRLTILRDKYNDYNMDDSISRLLFTNEYHEILWRDSFYVTVRQGDIYLIYEKNESGDDGSLVEGYRLYLLEDSDPHNGMKIIDIEKPHLFALSNAIESYIDEMESDAISFITNFLGNPD